MLRIVYVILDEDTPSDDLLDLEIPFLADRTRAGWPRNSVDFQLCHLREAFDLAGMLTGHRADVVHLSLPGGWEDRLSIKEVVGAFRAHAHGDVRLVVLHAPAPRNLAEALSDVVDCVVSIDRSLDERVAYHFVIGLYFALSEGISLHQAYLFCHERHFSGILRLQSQGAGRHELRDLRELIRLVLRRGVDASAVILADVRGCVAADAPSSGDFHDQERAPEPTSPSEVDNGVATLEAPPIVASSIACHSDISFPERVPLHQYRNLRIRIVPAMEVLSHEEVIERAKPHPHDARMALRVPSPTPEVPSPQIRITVSIAAENFDIEGPVRAELLVTLEGTSEPVNFSLCGIRVGRGRVMVDFLQDGRPVGSVDLESEVVAAGLAASTSLEPRKTQLDLLPDSSVSAPDLVLKVFEHRLAGQPGRLQFVASSPLATLRDLPLLDGDFGGVNLNADVASWVDGQLGVLTSLARSGTSTSAEASSTLATVGENLFDRLLPSELKDLYWTLQEREVKSILVLSDDPHIPWELIKPYRKLPATGEFEKGRFWGESYALTHWLRGRPPVSRFSFGRVCAIALGAEDLQALRSDPVRDLAPVPPLGIMTSPPSTIPGAGLVGVGSSCVLPSWDQEVALISGLESRGARFRLVAARRSELLQTLTAGEFDLLHLASHGRFGGTSSADASAVLLEDGTLLAGELSPTLEAALRRSAPLIFFNCCQTGCLGYSLTRLGSWGARFVELGCGGFVGTLWPVTDRAALCFARAFYEALTEGGRPIGEAMQRARLKVREEFPDDPTWLAYCCFADPLARVANPTSASGGSRSQTE